MDIFYIKSRKNLSLHRNSIYRLYYKKHCLFHKRSVKLSCHDYFFPLGDHLSLFYQVDSTFRNLKPNFDLFFKPSLSAMARIAC